ncbi:hypothetical protein A0H81_04797 [Grifola frondosa]|uniref:Uncharacterized protein n=1 Tax=Grifola frondosa TaxID=5627 RepID=A0A1C7MLE8_GRIFR|nr:hypothetical protein A0H81_04797 [Grifola frondosa]
MFSRFGGDGSGWEHGLEGLGIHPTAWPDSEKSGFIWQCKETLVRTHDWYNIPSFLSIPEKAALSSEILIAPQGDLPNPILSISYFSAASFPLAFPPTVARGFGWPAFGFGVENNDVRVNAPEKEEGELRIRGWALMDFYTDPTDNALVPLLVECNFRGRNTGEEGWL